MPPSAADLDRLRSDGWSQHDPLRWRIIESLAARSATSDDALRARLDARVSALLAQYEAARGAASGTGASATAHGRTSPSEARAAGTPRPLAALLAHIAAHAPASGELRTLQRFRHTWSRLAADRQVARSHVHLPPNAGPLNSQRLVHRAMTLMRDLSPEYLERFVAHADALLWLDRVSGGDLPSMKDGVAPIARDDPKGKRRKRR